jgi:UDP-3-O-[3-hydroxymyristoyl] glucosamine N-acyltransferase
MAGMPPTDPAGRSVSSTTVARFLDARHVGDPCRLTGIGSLSDAGPRDLAFSVHEDPALVEASGAGTVVCLSAVAPLEDRTLVLHERPQLAFVRAVREFLVPPPEPTVHPTATIAPGATVGDCHVGPGVHVGPSVTIEDGATVGAGTVLGGPGFGFQRDEDGRLHRQPHVGEVVVEADAAIGPNCSVDRAVFDRTVVGEGAKLSGNVHLAHQARVGAHTTVAFGSGLAGGATLGERVMVHPGVAVATDVEVGDDAELGMHATVLDDVPADTTVVGTPAREVGATTGDG